MENDSSKSRAKIIDEIAAEIFIHLTSDNKPLDNQQTSVQRYYRKIARWHYDKLLNSQSALLRAVEVEFSESVRRVIKL